MGYAHWDKEYRTGIEIIDIQHQQLFTILNRFLELAANEDESNEGTLAALFENLRDYAQSHFETEEELMRAHGYPDRKAHEVEHQYFTEQFSEYEISFLAGHDIEEIMPAFLVKWIHKHIKETDSKLARFLCTLASPLE